MKTKKVQMIRRIIALSLLQMAMTAIYGATEREVATGKDTL